MASSVHEVICMRWQSLETLHVPQFQQSAGTQLHFELGDSGDGVEVPETASDETRWILSWCISQEEPSQLQLTETHVQGHRGSFKRTIAFGSHLFPKASYHIEKGLIVLTADGSLHSLIPRDQGTHLSLLDELVTSTVDVRHDIERLGTPTTLNAFDFDMVETQRYVCIGGKTGSLLLVPPSCFDNDSTAKPFELQHSPSGYRAFFSKGAPSAITWAGCLGAFAPGLLCVLHADCSLRFWSVSKRQRLLVETLLQQSGQQGVVVPKAVGSMCSQNGHLRLVVHLEPKFGAQHQPQTVAVSMNLQIPQEGSIQAVNMRERMLEHDSLRFQTVLTHTRPSDPHSANTWLLSGSPSLHAITSSVSGQPHEEVCRTVLIEKQGVVTGQAHQPLQVGLSQHFTSSCRIAWAGTFSQAVCWFMGSHSCHTAAVSREQHIR